MTKALEITIYTVKSGKNIEMLNKIVKKTFF